jgi:hypothetical protein
MHSDGRIRYLQRRVALDAKALTQLGVRVAIDLGQRGQQRRLRVALDRLGRRVGFDNGGGRLLKDGRELWRVARARETMAFFQEITIGTEELGQK